MLLDLLDLLELRLLLLVLLVLLWRVGKWSYTPRPDLGFTIFTCICIYWCRFFHIRIFIFNHIIVIIRTARQFI